METVSGEAVSFSFALLASSFRLMLPTMLSLEDMRMRANGFMAARAWGLRAAVHSCETNCWRMGVWAALKAWVLIERRALLEAPERSILAVAAGYEWTGGSEEGQGTRMRRQ